MNRPTTKRLHIESLERRLVLDGTPIGNGEIALGQVSPAEPTDLYTFAANAGERVWVAVKDQLERTRFHALTSDYHFDLEIESPSGQLYSDVGLGAAQSFVADASGEYEIRIRDFEGDPETRDYEVRLLVLPEEVAFTYEQDAFLSDGEHFSNDLEIGDLAIVQFEANAGAMVYPEWEAPFVPGDGGNLFVTLVAPDGQVVGDSNTLTNSKNFTAPSTGLYTAVLTEFGSDDDLSFTFTVASLPGEIDYDLPQNELLAPGEQREAVVETDEQHLVQFNATAGQELLASLRKTLGSSALGNPRLRVVDPSGTLILDRIDDSQIHQLIVAETTGLYTAIITKDPNQPSNFGFRLDYTFSLDNFPADYSLPRNTFLRSGEQLVIPPPAEPQSAKGYQYLVQFEAEAGSKIFGSYGEVDASTSNGYPELQLLDPEGNLIFESLDDIGIGFLKNAPTTGLYTAVLVFHFDRTTDLIFTVTTLPGSVDYELPNNEFLANGGQREADLGSAEQHIVQFEAEAGSTLAATLEMTGGDDRARPRIRLVDPKGRVLSNDSGPLLNPTLTASATGLYTAVITEVGSNEPYSYRFQVNGFAVGDYNRDGFVDAADKAFWSQHYGAVEGIGLQADGNGNGRVDAGDYAIWRDNQQPATPPAALVEPSQTEKATAGAGNAVPVEFLTPEKASRPQRFRNPLRSEGAGEAALARETALLVALSKSSTPNKQTGSPAEEETSQGGRERNVGSEPVASEAAWSEFGVST